MARPSRLLLALIVAGEASGPEFAVISHADYTVVGTEDRPFPEFCALSH